MSTSSRSSAVERLDTQPETVDSTDTTHVASRRATDAGSPNAESIHLVVDLTGTDPQLDIDLRPYLTADAGLITASRFSLWIKRAIDVVGSMVLLVLLSPVFAVIALAVASTSPGPTLFKQRRVGKDGHEFEFYKFRSMGATAEQERYLLIDGNECNGPVFKIRSDPRVTTVGRFIRRTSLDEMPQLWNVLRGNMSLVGPRPPLPNEVHQYSAWERQRLAVRPGITGIWQVSGRSDLDFETWVTMDIRYIQEWRLWLDLVLLIKTIPAALSGRGAY